MKKFTPLFIFIVILNSCSSSKNYVATKNKDNALQKDVQKLNKDATNITAIKSIPILYKEIQQAHLAKIKSYSSYKDSSHWNIMIAEYDALQDAYNTIINSPAALKLATPTNYNSDLQKTKEIAAEHFYELAQSRLEKPGRDNAKGAYDNFKIADNYMPAYKDTKSKISIAYGRAVINIVIDSLNDNSYFASSKWGEPGYDLSNEFFQKKLKADLENASLNNKYPIVFYIKDEAQKSNVRIDWLVTLNLIDLNITSPKNSSFTIPSYSNQTFAENTVHSTDNSFGPVEQPPYRIYNYTSGNITTVSTDFLGSTKMKISVGIKNVTTERDIILKTFKAKIQLHQDDEYYDNGLAPVQFSNLNNPQEQELAAILKSIYTRIYSQVKDNISLALK
jgi:hypothetical protein